MHLSVAINSGKSVAQSWIFHDKEVTWGSGVSGFEADAVSAQEIFVNFFFGRQEYESQEPK